MAQLFQMAKGQLGSAAVIQNYVGDVFHFLMAGNSDGGQQRLFVNRRINGDDSLDAARLQHLRVRPQELRVVAMGDGQEEVIVLPETGFDTTADQAAVSVPNLLGDDTHGKAALYTQRPCEEIGAVV